MTTKEKSEVPEKKYTITDMWLTHKTHCIKTWKKSISKNSFYKRYLMVKKGEMTVKEMIETPSNNTVRNACSLQNRCEYYDIPYHTVYEWIRNKWLSFEDCLYKKGVTPDKKEMGRCSWF